MQIVISGSGGYIGQKLMLKLIEEGHGFTRIERHHWKADEMVLANLLAGADAVIHLAGAPILQRWTSRAKEIIYKSRIDTTSKLVKALKMLPDSKCPRLFIGASAVGIYQTDQSHDETSTLFDPGFVGNLVSDWERSSEDLPTGMRRVIFRIGPVVGSDSKMIRTMLPAFRLMLGGSIGNGNQPFPFVHIADLVQAFRWALITRSAKGIYNLVAPVPVSNKQFVRVLAHQLHRPAWFPVPEWALKLLYGQAAEILIRSPRVIPGRLLAQDFVFSRPDIETALFDVK